MANDRPTLYVGVTNNLLRRTWQHKNKLIKGFTQKYNLMKLVYYETYDNPNNAIEREKTLKKFRRKQKLDLIRKSNPKLIDLYQKLMKDFLLHNINISKSIRENDILL